VVQKRDTDRGADRERPVDGGGNDEKGAERQWPAAPDPLELRDRLAALVPLPYLQRHRYFVVLARNFRGDPEWQELAGQRRPPRRPERPLGDVQRSWGREGPL
jgi:hypothetical protein